MGESLRLLLFSPRHPSDPSVGVANVVSAMAERWAAQGHAVRVAYPAIWSPGGAASWRGVRAVPLDVAARPHVPKSLERSIASAFATEAEQGTDAAVANNEFGARLPSRRRGGPTLSVLVLHGLVLRFMELERATRKGLRPRLGFRPDLTAIRSLESEAIDRADEVVAISGPVREDAIRTYAVAPERVKVIRNGSAPSPQDLVETRAEARRALGLEPDGTYLVFLGGDPYRKGLDIAREAVQELRAHGSTVTLLNVGNAERSADGVRSFGRVDETTKARIVRASDALVLPSRYEGFPAVAQEAAMAGLPVVASRTAGLDVGVPGKDFLQVDSLEPSSWAASLQPLLADPALRARIAAGGRQALTSSSFDQMAEEYLALIRGALRADAR